MKKNKKKSKPKKKLTSSKIKKLKPYERLAHDVLKNADRKLSTNEIAQYANMGWPATKKNLESLYKKRKSIHREKKGRTIFWLFKK